MANIFNFDIFPATGFNFDRTRLPHVHDLIRYLEWVPVFTRKICGTQMKKAEKILITGALLFVAFGSSFAFTSRRLSTVSDLYSFTNVLIEHLALVAMGCCIWYVWSDQENAVTLSEYGDTSDSFVAIWTASFFITWILHYSAALFALNFKLVLIITKITIFNASITQMFLLKYMIVMRLKVLKRRILISDPLNATTTASVRSLLKINDKINEFYSPYLFFWVLFRFTQLLAVFGRVWYSWVLEGVDPDYYNVSASKIALAIRLSRELVMFGQTSVRRQLDESIASWTAASATPRTAPDAPGSLPRLLVKPIAERKKIFALLQELDQVATEATGLDLFTVTPASVVSALDLLINLAMFFIQYL